MRYILQVISRAMPGRDDEYNEWYNSVHAHEVLALPGFLSCTRYRKTGPGAEGPPEYVAAYEVETDDPAALIQNLFAASETMQLTDSIDTSTARFEFLEPIGPGRVEAKS